VPPLATGVVKVLLGKTFMETHPEDTALVVKALRDAPRDGMHRAMRAVMLNRPDLTPLLSRIDVPTMMVAPRNDPLLTVEQVRAAVDSMPHASAVELDAEGHVACILTSPEELTGLITQFWSGQAAG
jgi:pimeloyl-ACP methyl ester carboxylesterase